jgi:hypothetical protein
VTGIKPPATGIKPPREFGAAGMALCSRIQGEFCIDDEAGRELLAQACGALDQVEELAAQIAIDGTVVRARGGSRAHPGLKDLLAGRAFIVRVLQKLGLTDEPLRPAPGRPPHARV